ncbi:MAG: hypothetical protein ACXW1T_07450 [Methylophilus sp.]
MKFGAKQQEDFKLVPTFYTSKMVANFNSFSPSAGKPAKVVSSWLNLGLPIKVIEPEPVTTSNLKLAHDHDYVDKILACEINNGFGNKLAEVADSLRYTTGSMLAAAREAIKNGKVAVAPCSGFHHAGYESAFGYCTFNGLMVTAMVLKSEGLVTKVGILDFDMHYGDGTDALIEHHKATSWIKHYSAGREYLTAYQADEFLARVPELVSEMRDCDVILYQAGADPQVDDPLGGFLTTEQLKVRDKRVFTVADYFDIPIAWNLAGGYQVDSDGSIQAVLEIHNNTMRECCKVYVS